MLYKKYKIYTYCLLYAIAEGFIYVIYVHTYIRRYIGYNEIWKLEAIVRPRFSP